MAWEVGFDATRCAVTVVVQGALSAAELESVAQASLALAEKHGVRDFFADLRGLEGGHNVLDLHRVARLAEAAGFGPGFREAVVVPRDPRYERIVEFWETACFNRGLLVERFDTPEAAWEWLAKPRPRWKP